MNKPKPMTPAQESQARTLLLAIQRGLPDHHTPAHQAMMLEHFNSHGAGKATFSHKTLGTKLRRFD